MNILMLGEKSNLLKKYIENKKHTCIIIEDKISLEYAKNYDFIISFGYRYIISKDIVDYFQKRIINMHISMLPYNRGADPNLWSFLENTPKGVSIHYMSYGLDEGDILYQKEVFFNDDLTLFETYNILINTISKLLFDNLDNILYNQVVSFRQTGTGSFHCLKDKAPYEQLLTDGYNTKVKNLINKAEKTKKYFQITIY